MLKKRQIPFLIMLLLTDLECKKPHDKNKLATWLLECELGITSDNDCPIAGGWSTWNSWNPCQGACDENGHRKRTRECVNPPPSNDGMPCSGPDQEIESCYLNNCSIEDFRKLVKNDPARSAGLRQLDAVPAISDRCLTMECPFEAIEAALALENTWQLNSEELWNALQCVKRNLGCPVSGQWSNWGTWSVCGARCGKGLRWRQRKCDSPPPSDPHLTCTGAPLQYEECEGDQCAIDVPHQQYTSSGSWSQWDQWTDCSENCGVGIRRRKRICVEKHTPLSLFIWKTNCRGQHDQLEMCSNKKCSLDGGWSCWSAWGPCSQTCGAGRRSRSRSCTRPIPFGEGANCYGSRTEVGACHLKPCDVYSTIVALFNGDSVLQYNFPKKHFTYFHFYIRFMPLSPTGTLLRRDNLNYPFIYLIMHKWHLCLDVSGSSKCILPRICSPTAIAPASWNSALVTLTDNAVTLRINDAEVPLRYFLSCETALESNSLSINVGERFHGALQEIILNFVPLIMFIEKERQGRSKSNLFPVSSYNLIYDKANLEEAFVNLENDYYLRVPCFNKIINTWHIKLTLKPKTSDGIILTIYDSSSENWIIMSLQNLRLKIKINLGQKKFEAISSSEYQSDQWLDFSLSRKKSTNIIEASINGGERIHILLTDIMPVKDEKPTTKNYSVEDSSMFEEICCLNNEKENFLINEKPFTQIKCGDEFYVGNIPKYLLNKITDDGAPPFSGTIASLHVNEVLINLHDCSMERYKENILHLSSRTASVSGSYHETMWGKSDKLNLTCLYSKTLGSIKNTSSWLFLDTDIKGMLNNKNITPYDDGKILRLSLIEDKDLKGFYTCRSFYNKRTRNVITYGVIGKIENKLTSPDLTTAVAVITTLSLVIFTLGWLIIEGINDIRDGYGFFRDAHFTAEKEAEAVCNYIDKNIHLLGSKSAARLAKAKARRKARQLASRASFAAQEPEGLMQIDKGNNEMSVVEEDTPSESLPELPVTKCLVFEPSHELFRCEPSYISSPRHGSNITSPETKITSSSSMEISPRNLCSKLLLRKTSCSSKEYLKSKILHRSKDENVTNKLQLATIKSSTIMNLSPGQRILKKFQELKMDDS